MLSVLRFCRAVKYRSVLHVNAVRDLGAESKTRGLEHVVLFLRVESLLGQSVQL